MTVTMPVNLVDDGAKLVHPTKAYILRHLPLPSRYIGEWEGPPPYYSVRRPKTDDPDLDDYILKLQHSIDTLFGVTDFELHTTRQYSEAGLPFHQDYDQMDIEDQDLIRMVSCVHNATDEDRPLHFKRPDWSNHTEEFSLIIPAQRILVFGGSLVTDYSHGIPAGPEAAGYRSVLTRFALWRELEGEG